jgi:hypothetical protein
VENEISTFEEFDSTFKIYNAFYGINFTEIEIERCITDKATYSKFRETYLWELTPKSFWERKEILFSKIILCDSVETDIQTIGGKYLNQIVFKLFELDKYVNAYWSSRDFNYEDANAKAPINISPESKKTMSQKKYSDLRIFTMPDGRRVIFELHIKSGNLRFHFYPENGKIYVGYIGKHLATDKYN